MSEVTIPGLQETTDVDENTMFPVDSGIQTYKASGANVAKGLRRLAPVVPNVVTSNLTLTIDDADKTYLVDTTGGAVMFILPDAALVNGRGFRFKDVGGFFGANNVTLRPASGQGVDGMIGDYLLKTPDKEWSLISNGLGWISIQSPDSRVRVDRHTLARVVTRNWDIIEGPANDPYASTVAWSPKLGLLVAISSSSNIYASPNGDVWDVQGMPGPSAYDFPRVIWAEGIDIFLMISEGYVLTSPDGVMWTEEPVSGGRWRDVAWSPDLNLFAAVAGLNGDGQDLMTSPDGINWTKRTNTGVWARIIWCPELAIFVAVGSGSPAEVMVSSDGVLWTTGNLPIGFQASGVAWSRELGLFVATGFSGGNPLAKSSDGINWEIIPPGIFMIPPLGSICWSPDLEIFVALSAAYASSSTLFISEDGVSWIGQRADSEMEFTPLKDIKWVPELGRFIAVGGGLPATPSVFLRSL